MQKHMGSNSLSQMESMAAELVNCRKEIVVLEKEKAKAKFTETEKRGKAALAILQTEPPI